MVRAEFTFIGFVTPGTTLDITDNTQVQVSVQNQGITALSLSSTLIADISLLASYTVLNGALNTLILGGIGQIPLHKLAVLSIRLLATLGALIGHVTVDTAIDIAGQALGLILVWKEKLSEAFRTLLSNIAVGTVIHGAGQTAGLRLIRQVDNLWVFSILNTLGT